MSAEALGSGKAGSEDRIVWDRFRVRGLGFRVWAVGIFGLGFGDFGTLRNRDSGFRFEGLGLGILGLGFGGFGALGFRV